MTDRDAYWSFLGSPKFDLSPTGVRRTLRWQDNIIIDPDAPELEAKAKANVQFRSENSEDVVSWNLFRTLFREQRFDVLHQRLNAGPAETTFWSQGTKDLQEDLRRTLDDVEAYHREHGKQQSEMELLVRQGTTLVGVEAKLIKPGRSGLRAWMGTRDTKWKYETFYRQEGMRLGVFQDEEAPVLWKDAYQLMRHVVVVAKIAEAMSSGGSPHLLAIWNGEGRAASQLSDIFARFVEAVDTSVIRVNSTTWQELRDRLDANGGLERCKEYLRIHPCLSESRQDTRPQFGAGAVGPRPGA